MDVEEAGASCGGWAVPQCTEFLLSKKVSYNHNDNVMRQYHQSGSI